MLSMLKEIFSLIIKRQDVTEMYPDEVVKPLLTKRARGFVSVDTYKCTLCGLCSETCPSRSIKIDKHNLAIKINYITCLFCGYCVNKCPEHAIVFSKEFEGASKKQDVFTYTFNIINISNIKRGKE